MTHYSTNTQSALPERLSVIDIFIKAWYFARYLKTKWRLILLCLILGASSGLAYTFLVKPTYQAVCTFVMEENTKEGLLSQYSGLASLAGIDVGGSGSGIFKGDNIIELYRSRLMLKKTLLSTVVRQAKKQKMIDWYLEISGLRKSWKDDPTLKQLRFDNINGLNRIQDSVLFDIIEKFNKSQLEVSRPDKKLNIVKVSFSGKDEFFVKAFTDELVANVNEFYVQTKTQKMLANVKVLEHQTDSVRRALNSAIGGVASATESSPLANPLLTSLRSPSQKRQVDVQSGSVVYGELLKNLELARLSLRQQTPLIQFIDQPEFPLQNNRVGKLKAMFIGMVLGLFMAITYIFAARLSFAVRLAVQKRLTI